MKSKFAKLDKPLLITTIIFFIFGLIMIFSASSMESFMRYNYSPYHYFIRQALFLIVGLFVFLFILIFPTKNYKKISGFMLFIIFLSLVGLLIYGYTANSAVSWYKIGPIAVQPSEFAKIVIILYLATYYEKNKESLDKANKKSLELDNNLKEVKEIIKDLKPTLIKKDSYILKQDDKDKIENQVNSLNEELKKYSLEEETSAVQ